MARFRDVYQPSRPPERIHSPLDELPLDKVGMGLPVQIFLFILALFPFVGIVIGSYYATNETHYGIRSVGRMILAFSFVLHFLYLCVACPLAFYLTFR
ncbi:MAG: hypothetical protein CUN55_14930 [Phototrophicales bacterium]|nr:MAG: hypothetical protein CUN55_14930 [Phototrophicales bacterium]